MKYILNLVNLLYDWSNIIKLRINSYTNPVTDPVIHILDPAGSHPKSAKSGTGSRIRCIPRHSHGGVGDAWPSKTFSRPSLNFDNNIE